MPWLLFLFVFGLASGEFPPKLPEDFFDEVKEVIDKCEEVSNSLQTVKPTGMDVLTIIYDPRSREFQRWLLENGTKKSSHYIFKVNREQASSLKLYRIFVQTRDEKLETGGYFAYMEGGKEIIAAIYNSYLIREAEGSAYYLLGDYMYRVSSDTANDLQRMNIRNHHRNGDGVWTDIMDNSIVTWNDIITPRNDKGAFNFMLRNNMNVCYQVDSPDRQWTKHKNCEPIYPVLEQNGKTEWVSLKVIRMIYPTCISDLDDTLTNNTYFRLTNDVYIEKEEKEKYIKTVVYVVVGVLVFLLLILCIIALILLILWRRSKQLQKQVDIYEVTCIEPKEESSSKSYTARSPTEKSKKSVKSAETARRNSENSQTKVNRKSSKKLKSSDETAVTMKPKKKPASPVLKKPTQPVILPKDKINVDMNSRVDETSKSTVSKPNEKNWLIADKNAQLFAKKEPDLNLRRKSDRSLMDFYFHNIFERWRQNPKLF